MGSPESGTGPARAPAPPRFAPAAVLVLVIVTLLVPVFAHGCHGDDVDHEPAAAPPLRHPEPTR